MREPICPISTTSFLKSIAYYSVKEPPTPKLSSIFIAWAFFISYSPATGIPLAVNKEFPRMMESMASSFSVFIQQTEK